MFKYGDVSYFEIGTIATGIRHKECQISLINPFACFTRSTSRITFKSRDLIFLLNCVYFPMLKRISSNQAIDRFGKLSRVSGKRSGLCKLRDFRTRHSLHLEEADCTIRATKAQYPMDLIVDNIVPSAKIPSSKSPVSAPLATLFAYKLNIGLYSCLCNQPRSIKNCRVNRKFADVINAVIV